MVFCQLKNSLTNIATTADDATIVHLVPLHRVKGSVRNSKKVTYVVSQRKTTTLMNKNIICFFHSFLLPEMYAWVVWERVEDGCGGNDTVLFWRFSAFFASHVQDQLKTLIYLSYSVSLLRGHLKATKHPSFSSLFYFRESRTKPSQGVGSSKFLLLLWRVSFILEFSLALKAQQAGTRPAPRVTWCLVVVFYGFLSLWSLLVSTSYIVFRLSSLILIVTNPVYTLLENTPLSSMPRTQSTQHFHWGTTCILFTLINMCTSCYATHLTYVT